MDYQEFRSRKVWVRVVWGEEPDPDGDPENQTPPVTIRVAYAPAALTDEDAGFIAQFERMRLIDLGDAPESDPPAEENRAQKRARERAERRADATPPGKNRAPTSIDYLKRLVVDWDLTWGVDADGVPVPWPVTEDSFKQIEFGLRGEIIFSILTSYVERPNRASSLKRSSEATTASGPTTPSSSSNPSTPPPGDSSGSTSATPNGRAVLSGVSGSAT